MSHFQTYAGFCGLVCVYKYTILHSTFLRLKNKKKGEKCAVSKNTFPAFRIQPYFRTMSCLEKMDIATLSTPR